MNRTSRITVLMLTFLLGWSSFAGSTERHFEIVPFTGIRAGGTFKDSISNDTLMVDESMIYGLSLDWDYDATGQLQLLWSRQSSQIKTPSAPGEKLSLNIDYYHFGGTYSWSDDKYFKPYVACSVGATNFGPTDPGYNNELRFSMALGLGLKYFFTPRIGLLVEGRGYGTLMSGAGSIFCSNGACQVSVAGDLFTQFEGRTGIVFRF
ncbi:MAG: hypothetical protein M0036_25525 [Desulfobacteraceae bacterium]|nr:hypothetical protein [Desulfobacteraceae bacterium]